MFIRLYSNKFANINRLTSKIKNLTGKVRIFNSRVDLKFSVKRVKRLPEKQSSIYFLIVAVKTVKLHVFIFAVTKSSI